MTANSQSDCEDWISQCTQSAKYSAWHTDSFECQLSLFSATIVQCFGLGKPYKPLKNIEYPQIDFDYLGYINWYSPF